MSGVSEGFQEMRELKRQRHDKWQRDNMQLIAASGLQYTVRDNALLFREEGKPKVDFYPSTGRWKSRGKVHTGGATKFIEWYKTQWFVQGHRMGRTTPHLDCTLCGSPASFVNNAQVYGRSYGKWPHLWLCQNQACSASVGVHPGTDKPLGTFADKATRQARSEAHAAFDLLWKGGRMKRKAAYAWLAERMNIEVNDCHIGMFSIAQCAQVVEEVKLLHRHQNTRVCLLDDNAQLGDSVTVRFPRGVTMQGTVIEVRPHTLLVQIGEGQHVAIHEVGR